MAGSSIFDLERQYAFYGAYHKNRVNVFIHVLFVWPIFFAFAMMAAYTKPLVPLPLPANVLPFGQYMVLNWSFVMVAIYAFYYISLDPKAGSLAAALCLACWVGCNALAQLLGFSLGWKVILVAQVVSWTGQFLGHAIFEKRAPALFDNLAQAFLMAPYFVLLEVLQSGCRYEPYPGFNKNVKSKINANLTEMKAQKRRRKAS
ncbi:hypothetical protein O6H91_07G106300 [Diphasiastrum complanatum]|uniref:Uncharacterized protein n=1 Tax=Diphasiastrum complanatum TaxID=34168 RepID=A0ACC2D8G4_DIPCM|nr:hypothetical protein O6H91_Y109200 [Diphasiastrum complanatum]KAJ7550560.1 hypothetical protein O6H91_07G106300 [Diphasiastrum complanatum]